MLNNDSFNTDWRRVASTIYRKPLDSKIFGQVDLDVTRLEEFVSEKRRKGIKITLTHMMVLAVARCLRDEVPALNTYIRRGRVVPHQSIDAMVSVLKADGGMSSIMVREADRLNVESVYKSMSKAIQNTRQGKEGASMEAKNMVARLPWPFRSWVFSLYQLLTIKWGLKLPFLKASPDSMGSFVISNIGSIGLETGYPALLPGANMAFVLVMGGVAKKPVVIDDEIVIRRIMSLSIVMDHRMVDASHGGKLLRYLRRMFKEPELLEN